MMDYLKIPIATQASIALLSAQLCFSGWHILGSVSFHDGADPLIFCMYRIILGTALMHAYIRICGMKIEIDPADYTRFFFLGVLSFVSMIFTALSLKFIAPSRFAIFQPTVPCITTGLSMFLGFEELGAMKVAGVGVAVIGAFLAEGWKHHAEQNQNNELNIPVGTAVAAAQVTAMGILLVAVKPLLNKYPPAVVSCVYFSVATVATVLLCLARIDIFPVEEFYFRGKIMPWVALVYAAVFTTLYAFIALSWGGKYLNPSVATVYFTFQPVGTIFLSATILGAVVTLPEVIGGLLIIAGLTITALSAAITKDEETHLYRHASGIEGAVVSVYSGEDSNTNNNNNHSSNHISNHSAYRIPGGTAMRVENSGSPQSARMGVSSAIELMKTAFSGGTAASKHHHRSMGYSQLLTDDWQPTDIENSGSTDADDLSPHALDRTVHGEHLFDNEERATEGRPAPEKKDNVGIAPSDDSQQGNSNNTVRLRAVSVDSPPAGMHKTMNNAMRRNQHSFY